MPSKYPEIDALKHLYKSNHITITKASFSEIENVALVEINFKKDSFSVLIQDEYNDLKHPNYLLHLAIVLRELEFIEESTDFLDWCKQNSYPAESDFILDYYRTKVEELPTIATYFPNNKIDSYIGDLDYQLNAGAVQFLRTTTYT